MLNPKFEEGRWFNIQKYRMYKKRKDQVLNKQRKDFSKNTYKFRNSSRIQKYHFDNQDQHIHMYTPSKYIFAAKDIIAKDDIKINQVNETVEDWVVINHDSVSDISHTSNFTSLMYWAIKIISRRA